MKESEEIPLTIEDHDPHLFRGLSWGYEFSDECGNIVEVTNTCPLDSIITTLYMLHKCKIMVQDFVELDNESSVLSRTFKLLDDYQGDDLGGNLARNLWLKEVYKNRSPNEQNIIDLWGDLDIFFYKSRNREFANLSPVLDTVKFVYQEMYKCSKGNDCQRPLSMGGPLCDWSDYSNVTRATIDPIYSTL